MANQRTERLGSEIQRALAQILREDVRDPRASSMISVLRAEVTPDLDICKVYISVYGGGQEQAEAVAALKKAAPYFIPPVRWRRRPRGSMGLYPRSIRIRDGCTG